MARILTAARPILSEGERVEAQTIVERAARMNPHDAALRSSLQTMGGP